MHAREQSREQLIRKVNAAVRDVGLVSSRCEDRTYVLGLESEVRLGRHREVPVISSVFDIKVRIVERP